MTTDFDVAILGSGFSGSITALILQQAGLKTLLIDRVSHPRFAIGESSTPAANLILRSLSDRYSLPVLDTLSRYGSWVESFPEVGCGLKRGFSYFFHRPDEGFVPSHDHRNELLVSASDRDEVSDTQWLRANVDTFLFCRAIDAGAYMIDDAKTTTIERSAETWRIEITRPEQRVRASARFVIDASGSGQAFFRASGRTPRQAKLMTRSRAIFGHFTELPPWDHHIGSAHSGFSTDHPFYCDDAAQHHLLGDAWMWWLRFRDNRTSVGLVLDETAHSFRHGESADVEWNRILMRFPNLFEALRQAAPPYRLAHTRRLQRLNLDVSGPGWALLPHSAGFIDPLHSTGIAHSLSGVERLTRILTESDSVSDRDMRLQQYSRSIVNELRFIDELVHVCYRCLADFNRFVSVVMGYFAAATTWERRRLESGEENLFDFLCADDAALRSAIQRISSTATDSSAQELRETAKRELAPFNHVGLFDPEIPNMYARTALPDA